VHQLLKKDFDNIKMHGTTMKKKNVSYFIFCVKPQKLRR